MAVKQILRMPLLPIERVKDAKEVLRQARAFRADSGDCCVGILAETAGCAYTVTSDQDASKLPGMRLVGEPQA